MQERFSDRARHAMALANLEAGKLNHDYLAPAHLLLGLIAEGRCVATEAMRIFDVDVERLRRDVHSQLEKGDSRGMLARRAHTKEMKEVIEGGIIEARKFGHRYVGTEHLLIALLKQENGVPSAVLRAQGLALDPLREKALALLRRDVDPAGDLAHSRHGDFEWMHQQEFAKAFRSPGFWHTLILAVDSANRLGAGEIEPVHLLLALLRDPRSGISELLAAKGVTADWVRERLMSAPIAPPK